jgi:hypothetical protein
MNAMNGQRALMLATETKPEEPAFPEMTTTVEEEPYDESDWSSSAPNIVIHHQPRTKVYTNINDQIVIRQERDWCENDDPFVYFSRENVPALIAALQAAIR